MPIGTGGTITLAEGVGARVVRPAGSTDAGATGAATTGTTAAAAIATSSDGASLVPATMGGTEPDGAGRVAGFEDGEGVALPDAAMRGAVAEESTVATGAAPTSDGAPGSRSRALDTVPPATGGAACVMPVESVPDMAAEGRAVATTGTGPAAARPTGAVGAVVRLPATSRTDEASTRAAAIGSGAA
ncbi:MAG: hypothetical protein ACRYFW_09455 [Janthinobacterium lividum]